VHAGDFGNVTADGTGTAKLDLGQDDISGGPKNDVWGRAVIVRGKDTTPEEPAQRQCGCTGWGGNQMKK
jgi:Cu/Zn superoxide dismutase